MLRRPRDDRPLADVGPPAHDRIELLYKDGSLRDIAAASDNLGIAALSKPVEKFYLAWPRWVT